MEREMSELLAVLLEVRAQRRAGVWSPELTALIDAALVKHQVIRPDQAKDYTIVTVENGQPVSVESGAIGYSARDDPEQQP